MPTASRTVGLPRPIHLVSFDAATIGHDMQLLLYDLVLVIDAALVNHLRTYPKLFTSMTVLSVVTAAFRDDLSGCNDLRQSVACWSLRATVCILQHDVASAMISAITLAKFYPEHCQTMAVVVFVNAYRLISEEWTDSNVAPK